MMMLPLRLEMSSGLTTSVSMELAWSMIYFHVESVDDLPPVAAFQGTRSIIANLTWDLVY